jgi:hypothetical protein
MGDIQTAQRAVPTAAKATGTQESEIGCVPDVEKLLEVRSEKDVQLFQVHQLGLQGFEVLGTASHDAIEELEVPDLGRTDHMKDLLGVAVTALLTASAGALAGWVVGAIAADVAATATSVVGKAIGTAYHDALARPATVKAQGLRDIRIAFRDAISAQRLIARGRFIEAWPQARQTLHVLSAEQLRAFNQFNYDKNPEALMAAIRHETFVAWTNFLAQAKHGAMRGWDHWQKHGGPGALPLSGAKSPPSIQNGVADPTVANVAPGHMQSRMGHDQATMEEEHYGVLEVFVYGSDHKSMRVVQQTGYRMRLDNVGPRVREEFLKRGGRVRDLPVNKIVRMCSPYYRGAFVDPPVPVASVLITADGYVRSSVGFKQKHLPPIGDDPGQAAKALEQSRRDSEATDANVTAFAEAAQDLPISFLER